MTSRLLHRLIVPAFALAAAGCADKPDTSQAPPPATSNASATTTPTPTTTEPAKPGVELKETTVAGLEHAIRSQRGKVVLIDVWFYG